jgi:hypothetical protein
MTSPSSDLSRLLQGLVAAPAQAQALCDAQWNSEIQDWSLIVEGFLQAAPADSKGLIASLLAATAPPRQILRQYKLDVRVRVGVSSSKGISIKAHPLNVGWEKTFGSLSTRASRLCLTVEAVPVPAMPSAAAGIAYADDGNPLQPSNQKKGA